MKYKFDLNVSSEEEIEGNPFKLIARTKVVDFPNPISSGTLLHLPYQLGLNVERVEPHYGDSIHQGNGLFSTVFAEGRTSVDKLRDLSLVISRPDEISSTESRQPHFWEELEVALLSKGGDDRRKTCELYPQFAYGYARELDSEEYGDALGLLTQVNFKIHPLMYKPLRGFMEYCVDHFFGRHEEH